MGYNWRHADVDAMESQYVKDPQNNEEKLQKVIDYNSDDCQATRVVKDWLVENLRF